MKKNKILSVLLSFVIAACLWVYVVSTVNTDDSQWIYNIPVTFINEDGLFSDRNLTLTEGRDATVNLKIYGRRQELAKLNNTNMTVTADLTQVTAPGEWQLTYEIEYPESVNASEFSIQSRSSFTVGILVDKLSTKAVQVHATFNGSVAEDYVPEPIKLEYETIEISGPKDLVDKVDHAQVTLERTNLSKSVSDVLEFVLVDGEDNIVDSDEIKCSVDKIGVEMPVYMVKSVPLKVDLIDGGGASKDHAVVTFDPQTISIKGDPAVLEGLNSITLGSIALSDIQTAVTKEFNIVIPDGMSNLTGDTATVTVELKNLKTKTFQVTNIELSNRPADYSVTIGTKSLQVQIRGVETEINELASSNIRAVADLSVVGTATGQYLVPVEIYVDGYSDVGAMGSYSVLVTISEAVATTAEPVEVSEEPAASAMAEDDGE